MSSNLMKACYDGNLKLLIYLIDEEGVDIHTQNNYAIFLAIKHGHLNIIKYLFEQVINKDDVSYESYFHILTATINNQLDMLIYLVEEIGLSVEYSDDGPFLTASKNGHLNIVKYIIKKSKKIYIKTYYHAICLSLHNDHFNVAKYLIQHCNYYDLRQNCIKYLNQSPLKEYEKMKCYVLLLYRIHDQKIPLELQKIIFNFI